MPDATGATGCTARRPLGPGQERTGCWQGAYLRLKAFPTSVERSKQHQHIFRGRHYQRLRRPETAVPEALGHFIETAIYGLISSDVYFRLFCELSPGLSLLWSRLDG